jgi:hypothetical protein
MTNVKLNTFCRPLCRQGWPYRPSAPTTTPLTAVLCCLLTTVGGSEGADMTTFVPVYGTDIFTLSPTLMMEAASFFETSAQCTRPHGGTFHRACVCLCVGVVTTQSVDGGRRTFSEVPVRHGGVTSSFGAADLTSRRHRVVATATHCCTQLLVTTCTNLSPHHPSYFFLVLLFAAS